MAALSCALDLVLGPANAHQQHRRRLRRQRLADLHPGAWPKLGTDRYPWYPRMRVFTPPGSMRWEAVMDEVAAALRALA
ncbi:MAG: hypothetical protein WDN45_05705 [Caulobacteraceae bacterium]